MKTAYYHQCDSRYLAIVDLIELDGTMVISRINVPAPHRSKGIGNLLLNEVIADADKTNTLLVLDISPSDGLNFEQLEKWYTSKGFIKIRGRYTKYPEYENDD
jgi:GNAT superfamily N-acetyltransferase